MASDTGCRVSGGLCKCAVDECAVPPAPTHADDEMLIDNIRDGLSDDTYNYRGQIRRYADELAALSQRLAELRARAEKAEAEAARLRDRLTKLSSPPYVTVHRDFVKPEYFTSGKPLEGGTDA